MKADPRSSTFDRDTMRFKSTRYVPEVVLIGPDEQVLGRPTEGEGSAAAWERALRAALEKL